MRRVIESVLCLWRPLGMLLWQMAVGYPNVLLAANRGCSYHSVPRALSIEILHSQGSNDCIGDCSEAFSSFCPCTTSCGRTSTRDIGGTHVFQQHEGCLLGVVECVHLAFEVMLLKDEGPALPIQLADFGFQLTILW